MDIIETITASLKSNKKITNEVSEEIINLVILFHKNFPNVNLDNLNKRLKTLKIEKTSKFEKSHISNYNPKKNILYFNSEELIKEYDAKHIMMFELLIVYLMMICII